MTSIRPARWIVILLVALAEPAIARQGPEGSGPVAPVVSPDIQADGRVTFRLLAPKATTVMVQGEFGQSRVPERVPMASGGNGVWSANLAVMTWANSPGPHNPLASGPTWAGPAVCRRCSAGTSAGLQCEQA